jgi:hypothetical protein
VCCILWRTLVYSFAYIGGRRMGVVVFLAWFWCIVLRTVVYVVAYTFVCRFGSVILSVCHFGSLAVILSVCHFGSRLAAAIVPPPPCVGHAVGWGAVRLSWRPAGAVAVGWLCAWDRRRPQLAASHSARRQRPLCGIGGSHAAYRRRRCGVGYACWHAAAAGAAWGGTYIRISGRSGAHGGSAR